MVRAGDATMWGVAAAATSCGLLAWNSSSSAFTVAGAPAGVAAPQSHQPQQPQLRASTEGQRQGAAAPLSVLFSAGAAASLFAAGRKMKKKPVVARNAMAFEGELTKPETFAGGLVGSEYAGFGAYQFDPAELSARYPEHLPWYREAELKHGRVAMLAYVGLVVPDFVRLPFDATSDPSIDFMNAHNKLIGPGLGEGPMWYLLVFCGIVESLRFKQLGLAFEKLTLENAGDVGFGKGFLPTTEPACTQMKIKELKNGRLAMLAVSGALTSGVTWEVHHFPFAP